MVSLRYEDFVGPGWGEVFTACLNFGGLGDSDRIGRGGPGLSMTACTMVWYHNILRLEGMQRSRELR